MKRLFFCIILLFGLGVYLAVGNIIYSDNEEQHKLDKRFEEVSKEVESYGGAMIVKYDEETGEIISKRPAYPTDAGVLTLRTQEEADYFLDKVPYGVKVLIVEEDVSPSRAVEVGGNI